MAAVRGFTLDKLASVRTVFSVFDSRATSTRCAGEIGSFCFTGPVATCVFITCAGSLCVEWRLKRLERAI